MEEVIGNPNKKDNINATELRSDSVAFILSKISLYES